MYILTCDSFWTNIYEYKTWGLHADPFVYIGGSRYKVGGGSFVAANLLGKVP
jgi:hypothetical protein